MSSHASGTWVRAERELFGTKSVKVAGAMDAKREKRNRRMRVLLAIAWLPYLMLPCPTCPDAVTRLVRCGVPAEIKGSEHHLGHHHDGPSGGDAHAGPMGHSAASERSGGSEQSHPQHAPGGDCCSYRSDHLTTVPGPVVPAPPVAAIVPWSFVGVMRASRNLWVRFASVEPHQNSPPIFLACLTLLL